MEIVFEVIGELVGAVLEWFLESERVPKGVRIALICLLDGAIIALLILILIRSESVAISIIIGLLLVLFLYGGIKAIRKVLKH